MKPKFRNHKHPPIISILSRFNPIPLIDAYFHEDKGEYAHDNGD